MAFEDVRLNDPVCRSSRHLTVPSEMDLELTIAILHWSTWG